MQWVPLDDAARRAAERAWRDVYGQAFAGRARVRQGARAEHEYRQQRCTHYLIVPFLKRVAGLPVDPGGGRGSAFECRGPLAPLGAFAAAEFFICPLDFAWTMVHTHEDHAFGGPYFVRDQWVGGGNN